MAAEIALRSLQPLGLLALREAGAAGYAICDIDQATGRRTVKISCGVPVPDPDSKTNAFSVVEFSLRVDDTVTGVLSFVFCGEEISTEARGLLERAVGSIEAVWRFSHMPKTYATLAAHVGELEAELADSKIADRARGLLLKVSPAGAVSDGKLDIIERHVEGVLRSSQLTKMLQDISRELEEKVSERKLVTQAKTVLERLHGMSEEEAHLRLQAISRKTRKPVKEVARALIESSLLKHGHAVA